MVRGNAAWQMGQGKLAGCKAGEGGKGDEGGDGVTAGAGDKEVSGSRGHVSGGSSRGTMTGVGASDSSMLVETE